MSKLDLKTLFAEAIKEVEAAHENYGNQSTAHRAALQIMQFEKSLYYGEVSQNSYLQKIRSIIENHVEDITNETKKN